MIHTERFGVREDGVILVHTYSDSAMMIRKNGTDFIYAEAVDVEDSGSTYTETDIPVESGNKLSVEDTIAMLSELGVETDDQ